MIVAAEVKQTRELVTLIESTDNFQYKTQLVLDEKKRSREYSPEELNIVSFQFNDWKKKE